MVSEIFEPTRKGRKQSNKRSRVTVNQAVYIQSKIQAKDSKQKWSRYSLEYRLRLGSSLYTV